MPYAKRRALVDEIEKMLKLGIIERSNSPYSAPIVLVPKKDGTTIFCIDFRRLNRVTVFANAGSRRYVHRIRSEYLL